jgi:multisubunit Na+/H+ antiporter MnhB subunit
LSVFLLVAGHNEPGGGFVGGLVASAAFTLHSIAFGVAAARQSLRWDPRTITGIGLCVALAAVWAGPLAGGAPLTGLWMRAPGQLAPTLGTPLLFDTGVYLIVTGATLSAIFGLSEER